MLVKPIYMLGVIFEKALLTNMVCGEIKKTSSRSHEMYTCKWRVSSKLERSGNFGQIHGKTAKISISWIGVIIPLGNKNKFSKGEFECDLCMSISGLTVLIDPCINV